MVGKTPTSCKGIVYYASTTTRLLWLILGYFHIENTYVTPTGLYIRLSKQRCQNPALHFLVPTIVSSLYSLILSSDNRQTHRTSTWEMFDYIPSPLEVDEAGTQSSHHPFVLLYVWLLWLLRSFQAWFSSDRACVFKVLYKLVYFHPASLQSFFL